MKRPASWLLLGLFALASILVGIRYFPDAFSIVNLDITMDRERALAEARRIATRDGLGPPNYQQAASFALDSETQTFVELEAGGKEAFTTMLRDGLYAAYTWRVRQFTEGEAHETLIRFTPEGRPYGFVERLKEDAPGAALTAIEARGRAESGATSKWNVDLAPFVLVEQGQERRPSGRVDHTFTYERSSPALGEGRYRLRLGVSGDRLTEITHFVRIPQAFTRRFESMRSANNAIGVGAAVGMVLVYIVVGIGVGLFYMLRARWVLWREALVWGVAIAFLQTLATLNELPLAWMTYDTALPRTTFLAQQIAIAFAGFLGFSALFTLSFIAAETLTRRAFGAHPQLWRVWSKEAGSSTAVLGRTAAGFLLVSIFFAYEVGLYLVATRALGWWTPSEALLHPDVLATYVPWLSAIANSLQAGFWEECLFRAVPIAGAALIGQHFGRRNLFIAMAFVVQALIFGAGHAPYPTLPSYARPVELIIPSVGFGLLYLIWGLLPAIILHFVFDVVWFALPIFVADAPGIMLQRTMVVVLTFVPLWVVLWRRAQAGAWTRLSPAWRNAAWTPPEAREVVAAAPQVRALAIDTRGRLAWLVIAGLALVAFIWGAFANRQEQSLALTRHDAARIARTTLESRAVTLGPQWRIMPTPQNGSDAAHEFVSRTAGEARRRQLIGTYLPAPHWNVRIATFRGDVAERAEEWRVTVSDDSSVESIAHTLPESRPGATLDEDAARKIAQSVLLRDFALDVAKGDVREVLARPTSQKARTDWTFTFADATVPPLPQGEPRITVAIAGDEVTRVNRFVFVPEEWSRRARAAQTRNLIGQVLTTVVFAAILAASAVAAVVAWSRRRYSPGLFLGTATAMFVLSVVNAANGWPTAVAGLPTSQPFELQVLVLIGAGVVGLTLISALVGLAVGNLPRHLAARDLLSERDALMLGVAAGLFGAAVTGVSSWLRTPDWAEFANVAGLGTAVPIIAAAMGPLPGVLTRLATLMTALIAVDQFSAGWARRRLAAGAAIVLLGMLSGGLPQGGHITGWLAAIAITGGALLTTYVLLLRADLTMTVPALGTMAALAALSQGISRPFPGALAGSILGALLVSGLAWIWFRWIRRSGVRAAGPATEPAAVASP